MRSVPIKKTVKGEVVYDLSSTAANDDWIRSARLDDDEELEERDSIPMMVDDDREGEES